MSLKSDTLTNSWFLFLYLSYLFFPITAYHTGAPTSSCTTMVPMHGFLPQDTSPPASIILDRYYLEPGEYVRVTLRSTQPIKGFLIKAVNTSLPANPLGTWSIPAYKTCSQYLQCRGGLHTAVTHTGNCSRQIMVTLQWRPAEEYQGKAIMVATVVLEYTKFWTQVSAQDVTVGNTTEEEKNKTEDDFIARRTKADYVDFNELYQALSEMMFPTLATNLVDRDSYEAANYSYDRVDHSYGYWAVQEETDADTDTGFRLQWTIVVFILILLIDLLL